MKKKIIKPLSIVLTLLLLYTNAKAQDDFNTNLYWAEKIDGESLIYRTYVLSGEKTLDISDLEIWSETPVNDPLNLIYWTSQPDYKLELLKAGLAKLKDGSTADQIYIDAQTYAQKQQVGIWSTSAKFDVLNFIYQLNWVWKLIIGFIGLIGLAPIYNLIIAWWRRFRVPLILIGRPSTGKSWLWSRLQDTDSNIDDLNQIKRTEITRTKMLPKTKPMGRFEISPLFVDTPGGQVGAQVDQLLDTRRWYKFITRMIIRQKTVWLIMLSTTQSKDITSANKWEEKIDKSYIEQQLGYLDLPIGILSAKESIKPRMVIACIGKFDLYSDTSPQDSISQPARSRLDNIFNQHISRLENACKDQKVPFRTVICSSLRGWGVDDINRYIEKALFDNQN